MSVPLGQYLQQAGSLPQAGRTLAAPSAQRAPVAVPEGPDAGERAGRAALTLAPRALSYAASPTFGGATGLGVDALATALGASGDPDLARVGSGLSLARPVVGVGADTARIMATTGAGFGDAATKALSGVGFSLAWNAPQIAHTLHRLIEGNEAAVRRGRRTADATQLGQQLAGPLAAVRGPGDLTDDLLRTVVGGATIGDSMASMLRYNLAGTWITDTSHGWLPDPRYAPLLRSLEARGYVGTMERGGTITRRESQRGDVGGVGEIVAGSGPTMFATMAQAGMIPEAWWTGGVVRDEGGQMEGVGPYATTTPAKAGAIAWDAILRRAAGIPEGAPSVFDPALGAGLRAIVGDTVEEDPDRRVLMNDPEETRVVRARERSIAEDYLAQLDPAVAERILAYETERAANRYVQRQGGNG